MAYFEQRDQSFLAATVDPIPGWLIDYAARISIALLRYQDEINLQGPVMEIGVYAGKYLSLLYREARGSRSGCVALDPFTHFSVDAVAANIGAKRSDATFITGFSNDFKAPALLSALRTAARFVSIDGSHDAIDVLHDLNIVQDVLHPAGIVAVDDFFNTECFGVVEAVVRFLDRKPQLVPFLFTSNKLFMAPYRAVKSYHEFLERFTQEDRENAQSANFANRRRQNRDWAQTDFCGRSVLVI